MIAGEHASEVALARFQREPHAAPRHGADAQARRRLSPCRGPGPQPRLHEAPARLERLKAITPDHADPWYHEGRMPNALGPEQEAELARGRVAAEIENAIEAAPAIVGDGFPPLKQWIAEARAMLAGKEPRSPHPGES